ncbi:MAG: hypothetical protein WCH34_18225 [Bacteroidota bacterium]
MTILRIYNIKLFPLLPFELRQLPGLVGAALIIWGTFVKMFSIPILGNICYWNHASLDGKLMLFTGILAILLTLFKQSKWLWLTASFAILLIIHTFYITYIEILKFKEMMDMMGKSPSISSVSIKPSIEMGLGLVFLLLGIIFMILGCTLRKTLLPKIMH